MKRVNSFVLWGGMCLLAAGLSPESRSDVLVEGNRVTAQSERMIVVFQGGDLIRMTNRLTQEQYIHAPVRLASLLDLKMSPAPGTPLRPTEWRQGRGVGANPDSAMTTFNDLVRTVTLTLVVEPETQDIVITIFGDATRDGVTGLTWGLRGLDLTSGRLLIPAQGGCYADAEHTPDKVTFDYPSQWEAQMAVWETKRGGFVFYSRDAATRLKKMHLTRRGDYADVTLETEAVAPFRKANGVPQLEWRLNTFQGDWRTPATGYRNLMNFLRPPLRLRGANDKRGWIRDLRTVLAVLPSQEKGDAGTAADKTLLDRLAKRLEPRKTLLYIQPLPKMLTGDSLANSESTDAERPDERIVAFMAAAQERGFRTMLHVDLPGSDPTAPEFSRTKRYVIREPDSGQPLRSTEESAGRPMRVPINPSSRSYREWAVGRWSRLIDTAHPDALHIGGSGRCYNDGSGLVDDKNYAQGMLALARGLLTTHPDLLLCGDGMNEVLAPYFWLAERETEGVLPAHPISTFLFAEHVFIYSPLPEKSAGSAPFRYEAQGVSPMPRLAAAAMPPEWFWIQARLWQEHMMAPDWGDPKLALFQWRGRDNSPAVLIEDSEGIHLKVEDIVIYERKREKKASGTAP